MDLRKTNSVDELNRPFGRTVPFGMRLFGGGGSTTDNDVTNSSESVTPTPPKAKIPSWYRNLHHSLLSMDGDDDDEDDEENEKDFEIHELVKPRRTVSVENNLDADPPSRYQHRGSLTDHVLLRQRSEFRDESGSRQQTRGHQSTLNNIHVNPSANKLPVSTGNGVNGLTNAAGNRGDLSRNSTAINDRLSSTNLTSKPKNSNADVEEVFTADDERPPPLPSTVPPPLPSTLPPPGPSGTPPRRRHRNQSGNGILEDNQLPDSAQLSGDVDDEDFDTRRHTNSYLSSLPITYRGPNQVKTSPEYKDDRDSENATGSRRMLPVCPPQRVLESPTVVTDEIQPRSSVSSQQQPLISSKNQHLFDSSSLINRSMSSDTINAISSRRNWTAELLARAEAVDADESKWRTQQQQRSVVGNKPATNGKAAGADIQDGRITPSQNISSGSGIVNQPKKFKWTVAETKSLGRPISANQSSAKRVSSTSNGHTYGTVGKSPSPSTSSPASSRRESAGEVNVASDRQLTSTGMSSDAVRTATVPRLSSNATARGDNDLNGRYSVTPNIRSLLAKYKSVEALSNTEQPTWRVASPAAHATTGRLTASRPPTLSIDSSKKFWSMENVAETTALSLSCDLIADQRQILTSKVDEIDNPTIVDDHVTTKTEPVSSQSAASPLIPAFAQLQLQKFRSLEEIPQRPPSPMTSPSPRIDGKNLRSSCLRSQMSSDDKRQQSCEQSPGTDSRQSTEFNQTSIGGSSSAGTAGGASTGAMYQSPFLTERTTRSNVARHWSPIVRMASKDWSPFSGDDKDDAITRLQRPTSAASVRNEISQQPAVSAAATLTASGGRMPQVAVMATASRPPITQNGIYDVSNGPSRRLPNTPTSFPPAARSPPVYGADATLQQRHGLQSSLESNGETSNKNTNQEINRSRDGNQTECFRKPNDTIDFQPTDFTASKHATFDNENRIRQSLKSYSMNDVSTVGVVPINIDVDQPSLEVKVMSSLYVTLQKPQEQMKATSSDTTSGTSRIRVISSRRVN